jgi:hypothetical protein
MFEGIDIRPIRAIKKVGNQDKGAHFSFLLFNCLPVLIEVVQVGTLDRENMLCIVLLRAAALCLFFYLFLGTCSVNTL